MFDPLLIIIVLLFIILGLTTHTVVLHMIKNSSNKREGKFFWVYHFIPHWIKVDLTKSKYYGMGTNTIRKYTFMSSYPTVDDEVVKEIASQLNKMCKGKSERYKAGMILAFVQQNVKYVSDKSQYDYMDYWAIPIQTLVSRKGDCEDTAILYCSIAYNLGIQVMFTIVPGHAFASVKQQGLTDIIIDGERWCPMETTSSIPLLGYYHGKKTVTYFAEPSTPTQSFIDTLLKV